MDNWMRTAGAMLATAAVTALVVVPIASGDDDSKASGSGPDPEGIEKLRECLSDQGVDPPEPPAPPQEGEDAPSPPDDTSARRPHATSSIPYPRCLATSLAAPATKPSGRARRGQPVLGPVDFPRIHVHNRPGVVRPELEATPEAERRQGTANTAVQPRTR